MTIKKIPEKWNKQSIAEAKALLQEYYNRPTPFEIVQLYINDIDSIGHAEEDVKRFLYFNGKTMISRLTHDICQHFKSICGAQGVPSHHLYEPATVKAYDAFIPMAERWLMNLKAEREQLKEEIAAKTE